MAYMNQERKAQLAPAIKAVLKKYNVKGTISTDSNSLKVTIREGALDFISEANRANQEYSERRGQMFYPVKGHYQANAYRRDDYADNTVGEFFKELTVAMRGDLWYDRSDIQSDYFETAYYMSINVGRWDKPYRFSGETASAAA